jgi:hypothetical protein
MTTINVWSAIVEMPVLVLVVEPEILPAQA